MRGVVLVGLASVLAVALASPAAATPVCLDSSGTEVAPGGEDGILVCYEATPLGGGLSSYELFIDPNMQDATSALGILISFTGLFNQILGFGMVVDEDGDASLANDFDDSYDSALDSFFRTESVWTVLNPFPDREQPSGIRGGESGSTLYQFSAGTTEQFGNGRTAPLAQLVAMGPIQYEGVVGFGSGEVSVAGEVVPEPGTAGLLALGLFGLGLQARRVRS